MLRLSTCCVAPQATSSGLRRSLAALVLGHQVLYFGFFRERLRRWILVSWHLRCTRCRVGPHQSCLEMLTAAAMPTQHSDGGSSSTEQHVDSVQHYKLKLKWERLGGVSEVMGHGSPPLCLYDL